ncbi:MAG: TonB-dependent receptor [Verrucomicrobiota bacterium]
MAKLSLILLVTLGMPFAFSQEFELEETIVTASKLEETETETLRSVGRVDSQRIENNNIRNTADAFRLLGNVSTPQDADTGFTIRGVNSENIDANNASGVQVPLITTFIDGVALTPQAARRGPLNLWDVETIEVLRGPQSTLQGKNSLGGSINIKTKDPTPEFEAATRVRLGLFPDLDRVQAIQNINGQNTFQFEDGTREDLFERAFMVNLPLHDTLFLRLSGELSEARSPVSLIGFNGQAINAPQLTESRNELLRGKLLFEPVGAPFRALLSYSYSTGSPFVGFAAGPNLGPTLGFNSTTFGVNSFFDRVNNSGLDFQIRDAVTHVGGLELNYELFDSLRATSLSSYTRNELDIRSLFGSIPARLDTEEDYSQELRLNWDDSWGRAVLGTYLSYNPSSSTQRNLEQDRWNASLFGEADFQTIANLYLITGARLSYDYFKSINQSNPDGSSASEFTFLPKAGLRYEFSPTHSLGATLSRGHRVGGASFFETSTSINNYTFEPELSWNYELAYRLHLFDEKLKLSTNAFYTDYSDQQVVSQFTPSGGFQPQDIITNAGSSHSYGAELSLSFQPLASLEFFASLGYLQSKFDDFVANTPIGTFDFTGYEFAQAPHFNGSFGLTYRGDHGFFASTDASFSSRSYSPYFFPPPSNQSGQPLPQDESTEIDPFFKVNLSLGYEWSYGRFSIFVNNLFNEEHVIGQEPGYLASDGFFPGFLGYPSEPRLIGTSLELRF